MRVAGRKMLPDVARRHGTQNGIDHSVKTDVGVAMPGKPSLMLDLQAAKPQFLTVRQSVNVEACTDTQGRAGHNEILRERKLAQPLVTLDQGNTHVSCSGNLGIVSG